MPFIKAYYQSLAVTQAFQNDFAQGLILLRVSILRI